MDWSDIWERVKHGFSEAFGGNVAKTVGNAFATCGFSLIGDTLNAITHAVGDDPQTYREIVPEGKITAQNIEQVLLNLIQHAKDNPQVVADRSVELAEVVHKYDLLIEQEKTKQAKIKAEANVAASRIDAKTTVDVVKTEADRDVVVVKEVQQTNRQISTDNKDADEYATDAQDRANARATFGKQHFNEMFSFTKLIFLGYIVYNLISTLVVASVMLYTKDIQHLDDLINYGDRFNSNLGYLAVSCIGYFFGHMNK